MLDGVAAGRASTVSAGGRSRLQPRPCRAAPHGQGRGARSQGGACEGRPGQAEPDGIQTLRRKPVFHTPNVFPPENFQQQDVEDEIGAHVQVVSGFSRTEELQHCYVCKKKYTRDPSLLRSDVPVVRRAELRQANRARGSSWACGAHDRRPREDRLSGRSQAASIGRPSHRDDAVSARLGVALLARAGLRRVGAPAGDFRPRPASHAKRRSLLPRDAENAGDGSTSSSTMRARPCAVPRRSTRT